MGNRIDSLLSRSGGLVKSVTLVLTLVLLTAIWPTNGTTVSAASRHFTLEDLCATAHSIVHAKVLASKAELTPDGAQIWTTWTLEVTERLKSTPAKEGEEPVTVVHTRGGVVGNVGVRASGEPGLAAGGEYLLFLWKSEEDRWCILGQRQGAFMVIRHEGGRVEARNSYRGVRVEVVDGKEVVEKVGPIVDTLDGLTASIRAEVNPAPVPPPVPAPEPEPAPETPAAPGEKPSLPVAPPTGGGE